jgi:hypothetical protein
MLPRIRPFEARGRTTSAKGARKNKGPARPTAPALRLLQETGGGGNDTEGPTMTAPRTRNADSVAAAHRRESASKRKNAVGRRKSLKRLNQRKTNAWISFRFSLDFLPKSLGFPSGKVWISFSALAPAFCRLLAPGTGKMGFRSGDPRGGGRGRASEIESLVRAGTICDLSSDGPAEQFYRRLLGVA